MDSKAGAADLHGRLRGIGERLQGPQPLTVCLFLDGENAWEYYPGHGREFLREFYGRIQGDADFRALTASEAIAAAGDIPQTAGIFPASWINANFDVWIGHAEDVQAWDLLWDAREAYARAAEARKQGRNDAPTVEALQQAGESRRAAEGSDWCWWYGPEHSTANDAEFDALYRRHLTAIYRALGMAAPDELAKPIKRQPERALFLPPSEYLRVEVNGCDSSYFEWLGAALYSPEHRSGAMHGRTFYLRELRYGFESNRFCVRVDAFPKALADLEHAEFRVTVQAQCEVTVTAKLSRGKLVEFAVEQERICLLKPSQAVDVAFERILEVALSKELLNLRGATRLRLGVALWHAGLPVDVLPAEGILDVQLGEENFAWPFEPLS